MLGWGIVKGLGVTLKHFWDVTVDDIQYFFFKEPFKRHSEVTFEHRQDPRSHGFITVQYPEEKLAVPERFRFVPFLVTDYEVPKDDPRYDEAKRLELNRCTSCGICAKICPPQCIWIVRTNDPKTGKPIPQPAEFYIDTDVCMNCGFCAEFCPFDAIIMDHDYELADYEREVAHIHDLDHLLKPASYYKAIRPSQYAEQEELRRQKEEEDRRKAEAKAKAAAARQAKAAAPAQEGAAPARRKKTPEEIKAAREAMLAKRKAREEAAAKGEPEAAAATEAGETPAAQADTAEDSGQEAAPVKRKRTPEEIQAQREAMLAKRRAREEAAQNKDTAEE